MRPASRENAIPKSSYSALGGCLNSDLQKVDRYNGSGHYVTYHYVGYGQAHWKQDLPKGP